MSAPEAHQRGWSSENLDHRDILGSVAQ